MDDVRNFISLGERTTWPKLDMIGNSTRISRTFLACRQRLDQLEERTLNRLQLAYSPDDPEHRRVSANDLSH